MKKSTLSLLAVLSMIAAQGQQRVTHLLPPPPPRTGVFNFTTTAPAATEPEVPADEAEVLNSLFFDDGIPVAEDPEVASYVWDDTIPPTYTPARQFPEAYLRPVVFDRLQLLDSLTLATPAAVGEAADPIFVWLNEDALRNDLVTRARQHYFVNHPEAVRYNEAHLPEPPKKFTARVDPETARIVISEVLTSSAAPKGGMEVRFGKKHWIKAFNANLQFSQAYVSPNWYQGGNNNLNALINIFYNVKLNTAFHPKWLFENTLQYKLGMNNAPDDELRDYSISEDLFQWNMTVGYKSAKRWYYSLSTSFKTQFLNNYKANTHDLKAAFMSPGELNVGIGMTYNYSNPKKTFTFDASISPLSWNMKVCTNRRMNVTSFGIKEGRKTVNEIGSSAEGKLFWQLCDNITLRSRLFVFSDYDYLQGDWENTLMFTINRFLTTQIYVHMRYDSTTKAVEDTDWHKLQMKEILSFGFTYKFNS